MFKSRRFGGDRGSSFAPINVGDVIDVTIEAQGEKGDGLAKVKGFVIFVPGAKQGERVKVKINKVLKKVGFAEVVGKATSESSSESEESSEMAESSESESTDVVDTEEQTQDSEDFGEEEY